jgi:alcohol dehydrogenase (cytochrome c)
MYVPDGWGSVYAIDVTAGKKGTIKWKMDPGTDRAWAGDVACCGVNNRGVALWKDKVISIALDGRMFAINKASGEVVWERKIAEPAPGETLTIAPFDHSRPRHRRRRRRRVRHPRLYRGDRPQYRQIGLAHLYHFRRRRARQRDVEGRQGARRRLGVETATYDPESDTFYQGVGNAGPDYDVTYRPGDNKWAASVLALSPNDGKIKWGFQYTPNDPYDYDEISEHPIINAKVNGEDRKLVVHAARNGFFYALDRANGSFIAGKRYVDQLNWTTGLDPKTGRPLNYDPNSDIQIYTPGSHGMRGQAAARTCPSNSGGKNWEPTAYNPELGLLYIPSIEGCNVIETVEQKDFADQGGTVKPRERFTGGSTKNSERRYGGLKAVDPATGETKVSLKLDYPNYSGALATGGASPTAPSRPMMQSP